MKETKFIELLNLYVDHEISVADAALLEAEIEANPARRRVYRQYCQMQKACTVLTHDFATAAAVSTGNRLQFPVRRRTSQIWTFATGLAVAAACVAFVFISRSRTEGKGANIFPHNGPAQLVAQADLPITVQVLTTRSGVTARPVLQTVFTGLVSELPDSEAPLANDSGNQFDWMNRVQLQRVAVEELIFEAKPSLQPDIRAYRSRQSLKGQVEMSAFQVQR